MSEKQRHMYTSDDFIRYHKGEMSSAEMHQLEKAALEDPFLSDALDGYAFSSEKMRTVLSSTTGSSATSTAVVKPIRKWLVPLSMAASLLLLLFAGYQFFKPITTSDKEANLAAVTKIQPKPTDSLSPVQSASNGKGAFSQNEANELASILKNDRSNSPKIAVVTTVGNNKPLSNGGSVAAAAPATATASTEMAIVDQVGYVSDATNDQLSVAQALEKKETIAGKDAVKSNDSLVFASTAPATAKMKLPAPVLNNNSNNNWAGNTALNEVVVTGVSSRKVKKANAAVTKIEAKQLSESDDTNDALNNLPAPSPNNGWDAFYLYCKTNQQSCNLKDGTAFHGSFKASFYINNMGKPIQISARSLSKECLKELKRLLAAGPIWSGDTSQKVEIQLAF